MKKKFYELGIKYFNNDRKLLSLGINRLFYIQGNRWNRNIEFQRIKLLNLDPNMPIKLIPEQYKEILLMASKSREEIKSHAQKCTSKISSEAKEMIAERQERVYSDKPKIHDLEYRDYFNKELNKYLQKNPDAVFKDLLIRTYRTGGFDIPELRPSNSFSAEMSEYYPTEGEFLDSVKIVLTSFEEEIGNYILPLQELGNNIGMLCTKSRNTVIENRRKLDEQIKELQENIKTIPDPMERDSMQKQLEELKKEMKQKVEEEQKAKEEARKETSEIDKKENQDILIK